MTCCPGQSILEPEYTFSWQIFSDKFKTIQKEELDKLKEEQKDTLKIRGDRTKELSKETNRRRK